MTLGMVLLPYRTHRSTQSLGLNRSLKSYGGTIYRKSCLTGNHILYHKGGVTRPIYLNPSSYRSARMPEKAIRMDKSNAMNEILTLLNEDGVMIPGGRAHAIIIEYMNFKIDRMGPEEALADVIHTKDHLVAQIHQMSM